MRDDTVCLQAILRSVDAIKSYLKPNPESIFIDRKTQKAILRELHELSESSIRLSQSLKDLCLDVPWIAIAGFRNVIVHDYLGINIERVKEIIDNDLPILEKAITRIINKSE